MDNNDNNGVLQAPASRMPETRSVPPQKRDMGGISMLLLGCAVLIAVLAFTVFRGMDTGATKNQEADVQAKNWESDDRFVQPTRLVQPTKMVQPTQPLRRDVKPPPNDQVTQTAAKPKPPAPKGFHDFHLGMTRKSVHALVERWKTARITDDRDGQRISNPPYNGASFITVRFEDGYALSVKNVRPSGERYFSKEVLMPSAEIPPDGADARLRRIAVEFAELKEGTPETLLKPLRDAYGQPDEQLGRQPIGLFGFAPHPGVIGPVTQDAEKFGWYWPTADRVVIAEITRYGQHTFGTLGTFKLGLLFQDEVCSQLAVQEALLKEQTRQGQQQTATAAETLRKGLAGAQGAQDKPVTAEPTLPIPDTLLGQWLVRGKDLGAVRWEGYLTLGKGTDREAKGRFEWLEGGRVGHVSGKAIVMQTGPANVRTLVFRADGDSLIGQPGRSGAFAAVITEDQQELIVGEWHEPGHFSWRAKKLSGDEKTNATTSPAGTWQLRGGLLGDYTSGSTSSWNATFTLHEDGTLHPVRRLSGQYRSSGSVSAVIGSFDFRSRRLWFRTLPADNGYVFEAYLTEDSQRLDGRFSRSESFRNFGRGRWEAVRDHLVPLTKPKWHLRIPQDVDSVYRGAPRASAFLEAMLEAYKMNLAAPANGEYLYLGRAQTGGRSVSRLKELPKGSAWFEWKGNFPGDDTYYMKTFNTILQKYGIPRSDTVLLVLPPDLVEKMRALELRHLKDEKKVDDPRLLRETRFRIDYHEKEKRFHIKIESQYAATKLSW